MSTVFLGWSLSLLLAAANPAAVAAYKEGMRLSKNNAIPAAIAKLEEAVKLDPEMADAWVELGNMQLNTGQMNEAAGAFSQVVRIRGDHQVARYNLAFALRKTKAFAKAAEQYRIYLQRDPTDADAWFGLAESLRESGEAAAAADAYEQYAKVETRPKQAKWVKKAEAQARELRKGAPPKAPIKQAKQAPEKSAHVSFSSKPKKAATVVDNVPIAEKDAPAVSTVDARAEKQAKRSEAFESGLRALKAADFEAALAKLEPAAKAAPEDAIVLAALGSAHLGLRNGKEAELAYRRALATAKPEAAPGIWLGIGEAMRLLGDSKQALEAFDHVAKNDSSSASLKQIAAERAAALK